MNAEVLTARLQIAAAVRKAKTTSEAEAVRQTQLAKAATKK